MESLLSAAEFKRVAVIVATVTLMGLLLCDRVRGEEVSYAKPAFIYAGLAAGDLASTYHAERAGAVEANPAMRSGREVKKAAQVALLTLLDTRLQKRDRRLAWGVRVVAIVGHGWLIHHNLKMAEKARRRR